MGEQGCRGVLWGDQETVGEVLVEPLVQASTDAPGIPYICGIASSSRGRPSDILAYVHGALLVDLWDDLVLPRAVRSAWAPLVSPSGKAEA